MSAFMALCGKWGAQSSGASALCKQKVRAFPKSDWQTRIRATLNHALMTPRENSNPILAAWRAVLVQRAGDAAILSGDGSAARTFADIESEARGFVCALEKLRPGAVVGVQFGNDARVPALLLALWRRGLVPVALDRSLAKDARAAALGVCGATALVTESFVGGIAIERLSSGDGRTVDADFLKLTSGTTGAPRAIRFRAAQLIADCEAVCDTMGIGADDLNFGVIPWSHSYGFSNLLAPLLCRGVPAVASDERLPRALLGGLARTGATVFPGLPVLFQKLADIEAAPLLKLRLCISAGAPLSAATAEKFRARFGVKIHSFYGSSECGGIAYDAGDDVVPEGCVGDAMRGVRLVHDAETGRVEVHGLAVGEGYFPEADESVLGGGRFVPGDLVRRTPQGFVLAGRVNDLINVAGRKLNPAEVEACLRKMSGVRDAMVFGVPNELRGEEPVACVVGNVSAEALRHFCTANLAAWQVPRDFWIVDALPFNERGKLSRRALAEIYRAR
jgi:acyl-CoA synthetase (AMP-forming)/AMP-acid ligase II